MRRIQSADKILESFIPLLMLDKPNIISEFDMKSKFLYHYPKYPDGSIDFNAPLNCTLLKFNFDWLTEYQDIGEENKLIDRELKIIQNI